MTQRTCTGCQIPIDHKRVGANYCTKKCRDSNRPYGGYRKLGEVNCDWCGKTFALTTSNRAQTCSVSCGMRLAQSTGAICPINWRQCAKCKTWKTSRGKHNCEATPAQICKFCKKHIPLSHGNKRYCSPLCKSVANKQKYSNVYITDCQFCSTPFTRKKQGGVYCTPRCAKQAERNRSGRFQIPDHIRQNIYQRDRWRCQLCKKKVPKHLPPQHGAAPSLDHILPQSLGGTDNHWNLQLAHRICNSTKRETAWQNAEQLTLTAP